MYGEGGEIEGCTVSIGQEEHSTALSLDLIILFQKSQNGRF
jgi:hypothetical protein